MADNYAFTPGSGATGAADDVGGVLYPRVKVTWGPDATANDADVASGKPLPVQLRNSAGQLLSDTTGVLISTTQVAVLATSAQAMSVGFQLTSLPTDLQTLAIAADTSRIMNGSSATALTPKWAIVAESSSGDNEVVAAVTSKKIRVIAWDVSPNAAVNFKWRSATTDKTGLYYCSAQGNGHARSFNPTGHFETASGEALNINLSGAVAVGGVVEYVEV